MKKQELQPTEFNEFYAGYLSKVPDNTDLKEGFENDKETVIRFFSSISKDKLEYRYQPEKWSIKEVLQHIIDTERVFMYRILRISRKDMTPIEGFDQEIYIKPSGADNKTIEALLEEFKTTRSYSINLLNSISNENLCNIGVANNSPASARACAFILLGHSVWHMDIIKERYLK
ncbi:DinB family protein [Tenacibaculum singaporense]|uniref:DinB family protein n=1 Tax=Tenacibaculum singaporense TaxID=2358479 RepID=A0A3Q8RNA2_9FLAO|nr:DinB family protein [Tenacibaculum singaporense]AZJ35781.1 DinB family protein [Tenacibaculum singaporense]